MEQFVVAILIRVLIAVILAVGLNLTAGVAGQLSLGHAAFMAVGAYSCAEFSICYPSPAAPVIGIIVGAVCAGCLALLIGMPVLRLNGDYLAVATLGLGEITRIALENMSVVGGAAGLYAIPKYTSLWGAALVAVLALFLCKAFMNSKMGLFCRAVREDELSAGSMGVNTFAVKLTAFVMSAAVAGVAGGLYGGMMGFISPRDFGFPRSVDMIAAVVLGGAGSFWGVILAAVGLETTSLLLQPISELRMVIFGFLLIATVIIRQKISAKSGQKDYLTVLLARINPWNDRYVKKRRKIS